MYSPTYENEGFCPYIGMQERFLEGSGQVPTYNLENSQKLYSNSTTGAFIPSTVTRDIMRFITSTNSLRDLSGLKMMGKSMSLVACTILQNLTQGKRVLLIPSTLRTDLEKTYTSIFETFWRDLTREQMSKLYQIKQQKGTKMELLDNITRHTRTSMLLLDQFSTFVGQVFPQYSTRSRKAISYKMIPRQVKQHEFYLFLRFFKNNFKYIIFSSSISFKQLFMARLLSVQQQQLVNSYIKDVFSGMEALILLQTWIKRLLSVKNQNETILKEQIAIFKCLYEIGFNSLNQTGEKINFHISGSMEEIKRLAQYIIKQEQFIPTQQNDNSEEYLKRLTSRKQHFQELLEQFNRTQIQLIRLKLHTTLRDGKVGFYVQYCLLWIEQKQSRRSIVEGLLRYEKYQLKQATMNLILPKFLCQTTQKSRFVVQIHKYLVEFKDDILKGIISPYNSIQNYVDRQFLELQRLRNLHENKQVQISLLELGKKYGNQFDFAFGNLLNVTITDPKKSKNMLEDYPNLSEMLAIVGLRKNSDPLDVPVINNLSKMPSFQKSKINNKKQIFLKAVFRTFKRPLLDLVEKLPKQQIFYIKIDPDTSQPSCDALLIRATKINQKLEEKIPAFQIKIIIAEFGINGQQKTKDEVKVAQAIKGSKSKLNLALEGYQKELTSINFNDSEITFKIITLKGALFTNNFMHYKPKNKSTDESKDQPKDQPKQLKYTSYRAGSLSFLKKYWKQYLIFHLQLLEEQIAQLDCQIKNEKDEKQKNKLIDKKAKKSENQKFDTADLQIIIKEDKEEKNA